MNQLSAFAYKYVCQNAQSSEGSVKGCAIFLLLILRQKGVLTLILGVYMLILGALSTSPNLPPPSPRSRRMMGIAGAKLLFTQQIPAFGHRDRFLAAKWPPSLRPHASQGIST